MNYARSTSVTESESRAEIESLLKGHGCMAVQVGPNAAGNAVVRFTAAGREVRMLFPMPADRPRERARRWRVTLLYLKAKLEAVDSGLSTLEQEFLAHVVLENGRSVGEFIVPHLPQLAGRSA